MEVLHLGCAPNRNTKVILVSLFLSQLFIVVFDAYLKVAEGGREALAEGRVLTTRRRQAVTGNHFVVVVSKRSSLWRRATLWLIDPFRAGKALGNELAARCYLLTQLRNLIIAHYFTIIFYQYLI